MQQGLHRGGGFRGGGSAPACSHGYGTEAAGAGVFGWGGEEEEAQLNGNCEDCDAAVVGGGRDALLLKCYSLYTNSSRYDCFMDCVVCGTRDYSYACWSCKNQIANVGNAVRKMLTPSCVAKAILAALRKKQPPTIVSAAYRVAFGPDYDTRILWISPSCGLFRIAEDGTAADIDDAAIPLPAQPWFVATRQDADPEDWLRWRLVFDSYEIISPIGQWRRD